MTNTVSELLNHTQLIFAMFKSQYMPTMRRHVVSLTRVLYVHIFFVDGLFHWHLRMLCHIPGYILLPYRYFVLSGYEGETVHQLWIHLRLNTSTPKTIQLSTRLWRRTMYAHVYNTIKIVFGLLLSKLVLRRVELMISRPSWHLYLIPFVFLLQCPPAILDNSYI